MKVRAGCGSTARISQRSELTSHRVTAEAPILIRVEQGCKLIRWSSGQVLAEAGDAVALAAGGVFDITNRLSPEGRNEAFWVVWDASLIRGIAVESTVQPIQNAHLLRAMQPQLRVSYDAAVASLADPASFPETIARHKLREVLLWIEQTGFRFSLPDERSIGYRVRKLIASEVSKRWTSLEIAHTLAVSEATLRRQLAEQNVGLRELLQDVRMTTALTLLQSTDNSVLDVGLAVGYDSASRFAVRFRERFGFSPSAIRGQNRHHHGRSRPMSQVSVKLLSTSSSLLGNELTP